jgi:acetoin utilization deacetylase AcuC-like enzyme
MRIYYSDRFVLPLPDGHRFPMEKYRRLREAVEDHPDLADSRPEVPQSATDEDLLRVHDAGYLARVCSGSLDRSEERRIGFPWSPGLVERSRRSVGGTIGAALGALADGTGVNLAGGTHHAFADRGEGFCVFNDVAVAIETVRSMGLVRRAGVLDLDVHQGNGTASIYAGDLEVFTTSVHGASNFPFRKERSDLDIPLPDGSEDGPFLEAVDRAVRAVRERGRTELAFYLAGADAFREDRLGRLSVSREALAERDRIVMDGLVGRGIPVAVVMAGGYAREVEDTVAIHLHSVLTSRAYAGLVSPTHDR